MRATGARLPRRALALVLLAGLLVGLAAQDADAQRMRRAYDFGQEVVPAYEGWEQNEDGSFSLVFGTMNRNWEEELHIPIGPDNSIEPGGPDQGQPTWFLPRRNRFLFRIRVPADFGDKELVWTLTSPNGETKRAYARAAANCSRPTRPATSASVRLPGRGVPRIAWVLRRTFPAAAHLAAPA